MVVLEVFNPSGSIEATDSCHYAPRLKDLRGKTICELSNGVWNHENTFPLIRQLLTKRFPGMMFVPYTELPVGVHPIDNDNIANLVVARGCDAVIGGNSG